MKISAIAFLFIALLLPSRAGAQWMALPTGSSPDLSEVRFASGTTGYAIGPNTILRTMDGGQTWTRLAPPGDSLSLKDLYILENGTLFLSASRSFNTKVYRSSDMAATWTDISPDSATGNWWGNMFLHFFSENSGVLVMNSSLWRTENGGAEWAHSELPGLYEVRDVEVLDSQNICIGGWDGTFAYKGILLKTADAGMHWDTTVVSRGFDFDRIIGSVSFISKDSGFAATTWGMFLSTTDGGLSWQTDSAAKIPTPASTLAARHDMVMLDASNGYWLSEKVIYRTGDGGISWVPDYQATVQLSRLSVFGGSIYATGDTGLILKKSLLSSVEKEAPDAIDISTAHGHDEIKISSALSSLEAAIYNSCGLSMRTGASAGNELRISTTGLPSGAYFLRIRAGEKTMIHKLTIVR